MTKTHHLIALAASATLTIGAAPAPPTIGAGEQWRGINADSDETGYSRLAQITPANIAHLRPAWTLELPGEASLQASPIAVDGTLYFTGSYASVYAVDAKSGKLKWTYQSKTWEKVPQKMGFNFAVNRGVAYANGRIFVGALDGRLIALDAKTGAEIWATQTTELTDMRTITGAPRAFNNMVVIGQGGADSGMRGYVSAYDQATGKQMWKFYIVPSSPEKDGADPAMDAARKTWSDGFWKKTGGGGGPWDSMTFDAALNRIYVGTANASPYDSNSRSPGNGDNLYTASIVALDATTGKYIWHYQINPRDSWDYDCTQQIMLAEMKIGGKQRKVLMQAPKNGFYYVIDRETGQLLSAEKFTKVTWADSIDLKTGRPNERAGIRYENGAARVYPTAAGAHSWMRMALNPTLGLVYIPTLQLSTRFTKGATPEGDINVGGLNVGNHTFEAGDGTGALVAWDVAAGKPRWKAPLKTMWNGGTMATAGRLVFQGTAEGDLVAYDAASGKALWRRNLGMGIIAAPMSYSIAGKQYVSVLAGYGGSAAIYSEQMHVGWKYNSPRRLVTFALDGMGKIPASPPRSMHVNAVDDPTEVLDPKAIALGKQVFLSCAACHGKDAVGAGGPAPDLRESPILLDKAAFNAVIFDGALMDRGMPPIGRGSFMGKSAFEAIRQYIRSQARAVLAKQAVTAKAGKKK